MPVTAVEYDVSQLLAKVGATLRGPRRADCPECRSKRTVSYTEKLYFCHHVGCHFRGNSITLAKELGLLRPLSPREAQESKRTRERARRAAEEVSDRLRERRLPLQEEHRQMLHIYYGGQDRLKRDRDPKIGHTLVSYAKKQLRKIRAELVLVEDAPINKRIEFLGANEGRQRGMISEVIAGGGLSDVNGTFIEVDF